MQEVRNPNEQGDDADGLHGGVPNRPGELRAHQGADTPADEHGNDVYDGSDDHGSPQYKPEPYWESASGAREVRTKEQSRNRASVGCAKLHAVPPYRRGGNREGVTG